MEVKELPDYLKLRILEAILKDFSIKEDSAFVDFLCDEEVCKSAITNNAERKATNELEEEGTCWAVWYFPVLDMHVKFHGYNDREYGVSYHNMKIVTPQQVTKIEYV